MKTKLILSARQYKRNNPDTSHCLEKITGKGRFKRLKEITEAGDCVTSITNAVDHLVVRYYA